MTEPTQGMSEERMDTIIGQLLRNGVLLSAAMVFIGGVIYLIRFGGGVPDYRTFHGQPESLRDLIGIVRGAFELECHNLIQVGLLVLIATPVTRVAFSLVAFAWQRDRTYVAITFIVLTVLLVSLIGSQHGW